MAMDISEGQFGEPVNGKIGVLIEALTNEGEGVILQPPVFTSLSRKGRSSDTWEERQRSCSPRRTRRATQS